MDRRDFLRTTMLAGRRMTLAPRATQAADARIDVLLDEPIARIDPNIYGHFVEHLGGVVYDGIWVGEQSRIANTAGIRQALVDHMRRLPKGVIRWPGGCFADSYDWRDGVGPREARPRRTNFWADGMEQRPDGPWKYDTEPVRHERVHALRAACARRKPYLAANLRSLPARDFYQWVEYCNSPAGSTTLADLRAQGRRAPSRCACGSGASATRRWGCGGNFTAEEYAVEYRRFTAWVPRLRRGAGVHRIRPQRRRPGLDARLLLQPDRQGRRRARQHVGLGTAPLLVERRAAAPPPTGTQARATRSSTRPTSGTRCWRRPT